MKAAISAITRAARAICRATIHIARRLTRKATIAFTVTIALPPFLKIIIDYKAHLEEAANDNRPRRRPRHTA